MCRDRCTFLRINCFHLEIGIPENHGCSDVRFNGVSCPGAGPCHPNAMVETSRILWSPPVFERSSSVLAFQANRIRLATLLPRSSNLAVLLQFLFAATSMRAAL